MPKNTNPARVAELVALLARTYPDAPAWEIARIVTSATRAAKRAKRIAEQHCAGVLDERAFMHAKRRQDATARRLNRALAISISRGPGQEPDQTPTITLGGDPRGPCGWLYIPGHLGDAFGNGGYALY